MECCMHEWTGSQEAASPLVIQRGAEPCVWERERERERERVCVFE